MTLECTRRAAADVEEAELARAKAQMKVALLTALETPGGRIERIARQLLAWGRVIGSDEIVQRVDAVTVDEIREAGRRLLAGVPTVAAVGPIKGLPTAKELPMNCAPKAVSTFMESAPARFRPRFPRRTESTRLKMVSPRQRPRRGADGSP